MSTDQYAMNFVQNIFTHAFRHPAGLPGWFGGMIMARTNRRMARQAIRLLDVQVGDSVLELGFGPGMGIQFLAGSTTARWVAGIDPSKLMVEQAHSRNATDVESGRVTLRRGSVEALPFENARFDKVLSIRSMQVWSDAAAGLREVRRVLRPGGRVVLGFTRQCGQTKEELIDRLTMAGFSDPQVVDSNGAFYVLAKTRTKSVGAAV